LTYPAKDGILAGKSGEEVAATHRVRMDREATASPPEKAHGFKQLILDIRRQSGRNTKTGEKRCRILQRT
jgi:hypothetical protein